MATMTSAPRRRSPGSSGSGAGGVRCSITGPIAPLIDRGVRSGRGGGVGSVSLRRARRLEWSRALGREGQRHGGAVALPALDLERAFMELDQPDGERQADAGPGVLAVPGACDLPETGDRSRDLRLIHADAIVDHLYRDRLIDSSRPHHHAAAGMAELERIGD